MPRKCDSSRIAQLSYNNLAWLYATCPEARFRNGGKALELARKACDTAQTPAWYLQGTLAAAYAEVGDFPNAVKSQEKSLALAVKESDKQEAQKALDLYKAGKPYRNEVKKDDTKKDEKKN